MPIAERDCANNQPAIMWKIGCGIHVDATTFLTLHYSNRLFCTFSATHLRPRRCVYPANIGVSFTYFHYMGILNWHHTWNSGAFQPNVHSYLGQIEKNHSDVSTPGGHPEAGLWDSCSRALCECVKKKKVLRHRMKRKKVLIKEFVV